MRMGMGTGMGMGTRCVEWVLSGRVPGRLDGDWMSTGWWVGGGVGCQSWMISEMWMW